jgi:hypothetical protein
MECFLPFFEWASWFLEGNRNATFAATVAYIRSGFDSAAEAAIVLHSNLLSADRARGKNKLLFRCKWFGWRSWLCSQ